MHRKRKSDWTNKKRLWYNEQIRQQKKKKSSRELAWRKHVNDFNWKDYTD